MDKQVAAANTTKHSPHNQVQQLTESGNSACYHKNVTSSITVETSSIP
jgi:hypothetical protein